MPILQSSVLPNLSLPIHKPCDAFQLVLVWRRAYDDDVYLQFLAAIPTNHWTHHPADRRIKKPIFTSLRSHTNLQCRILQIFDVALSSLAHLVDYHFLRRFGPALNHLRRSESQNEIDFELNFGHLQKSVRLKVFKPYF